MTARVETYVARVNVNKKYLLVKVVFDGVQFYMLIQITEQDAKP